MFLEHVSSLPEYKDVLPAFLDYVVAETPNMMPSLTGLYTEVTKRQMFLSSMWRARKSGVYNASKDCLGEEMCIFLGCTVKIASIRRI